MIVTFDQRFLTRREAAEFLTHRGYKTAPATLAKLAVIGGGPPYRLWGRTPLYDPATLLEWAQARCTGLRRSTSEIPAATSVVGLVPTDRGDTPLVGPAA